MLVLDPSEVRANTRLYTTGLEYTLCDGLEEMTGADFLVSAMKAPCNSEGLIRLHLKHGAILVQRKHGRDLVGSLEKRMKLSLAKMRAFGANKHQCVLLVIGLMTCDKNGKCLIDGRATKRNYWAVYGGLMSWFKYGGVVDPPLSRATLFPEWVHHREVNLHDTYFNKVNEWIVPPDGYFEYPVMEDPFSDAPEQKLIAINDWRQAASCCPGWGYGRVSALYRLMDEDHAPQTLLTAIHYMTTLSLVNRIQGVGPSVVKKACTWAGMAEMKE